MNDPEDCTTTSMFNSGITADEIAEMMRHVRKKAMERTLLKIDRIMFRPDELVSPFRVRMDWGPVLLKPPMLIKTCEIGPCWNPTKPPNRFVEYDASDRVWMEPLGMGNWE